MFSFRDVLVAAAITALAGQALAQSDKRFEGVGRAATAKEVAAWDIDVRPDFKGIPKGSGSVAQGQDIWESKCSHCHGVFGDSGEVFSPLIGGITADDVKTGHVAKLRDPTAGRTTFMKVATLSTIFDYINRAMPWTSPKSLKPDEVYAVLAFLLNLSNVLPDDFVLSDQNIAEVQKRMPNRNGMTTAHAMWPGNEFADSTKVPDVKGVACMKDCATETKVSSYLPEFARNAHGNLADQNRIVGPQRGAITAQPEAPTLQDSATRAAQAVAKAHPGQQAADAPQALISKNGCSICHAIDTKIVGPAFADVAKKYPAKADYLAAKIRSGGTGIWGDATMPAQTLPDADLKRIAAWLASGAAK